MKYFKCFNLKFGWEVQPKHDVNQSEGGYND